MPDRTFKLVELVGVSNESVQRVVRNAIKRASVSLKGMSWFEVTEIRGLIADGDVSQFQVSVKLGFRILDEAEMQGS
jgi:dodecin